MNEEVLLTVNEVAHRLRVSPQSVRNLIRDKRLRARRIILNGSGNRAVIRIPESALAEWNQKQAESA